MYCGIDVSKNKSQVCILSSLKEVVAEFAISHDKCGFQKLEKHLTKESVIGMESTSNYCKALFFFLKEKYQVWYVDNAQMRSFAKLSFPTIKNDKIDARLIALYLTFNFKRIEPIRTDEIKDLVRLYYKTLKNLTRYKYMFQSQINVIFPELEEFCHLRKTLVIANMLLKYPSPKEIANADTKELRHELVKNLTRGSRFTLDYAKRLQELARNSVGVKDYPTECFTQTIKFMLFYEAMVKEITQKLKDSLSKTPYYSLLDEFGYNVIGLSTLVGEVGDIRRFSNHRKFVKYCGYDVSEKQSGKSMSVNCFITKRGDRLLRSIFYRRVMVHLCYKTEIGQFFYRLKAAGKHPKKCMVAAARKLAVKAYYDMMKCHNTNPVKNCDPHPGDTDKSNFQNNMNYSGGKEK